MKVSLRRCYESSRHWAEWTSSMRIFIVWSIDVIWRLTKSPARKLYINQNDAQFLRTFGQNIGLTGVTNLSSLCTQHAAETFFTVSWDALRMYKTRSLCHCRGGICLNFTQRSIKRHLSNMTEKFDVEIEGDIFWPWTNRKSIKCYNTLPLYHNFIG